MITRRRGVSIAAASICAFVFVRGFAGNSDLFGAGANRKLALNEVVRSVLDETLPTLSDGSSAALWQFEGEIGAVFCAEMRSEDFDAYLFVVAPDGSLIAEDDDSLGTDSLVEFSMNGEGRVGLIANSAFPGESGRYELQVNRKWGHECRIKAESEFISV